MAISMNTLSYLALLAPIILLTLTGILISAAKKDTTMSHHHFAGNFDIKGYNKKVIALFFISGVLFSLGGLLIIRELTAVGLALLIITLVVFIVSFIILQKRY